jgi:hypothetical protein
MIQYSDRAIQTLRVLKSVFKLTYRSLEGFGCLLMSVMGLNLRILDRKSDRVNKRLYRVHRAELT